MPDIILENVKITTEQNEDDYNEVCNKLYE